MAAQGLRRNLERRTKATMRKYNMRWSVFDTDLFIDRLVAAHFEGIDDLDLWVLVRFYNREIIGKRKQVHETQDL